MSFFLDENKTQNKQGPTWYQPGPVQPVGDGQDTNKLAGLLQTI